MPWFIHDGLTDQGGGFIFIGRGQWSAVLRYLPFQNVFFFGLTIVVWFVFLFFIIFRFRSEFSLLCFCCFNINPLQKSRTRILFAYIYTHTPIQHTPHTHSLPLFRSASPCLLRAPSQSALKAFVRFRFLFCILRLVPFVLIYFVVLLLFLCILFIFCCCIFCFYLYFFFAFYFFCLCAASYDWAAGVTVNVAVAVLYLDFGFNGEWTQDLRTFNCVPKAFRFCLGSSCFTYPLPLEGIIILRNIDIKRSNRQGKGNKSLYRDSLEFMHR